MKQTNIKLGVFYAFMNVLAGAFYMVLGQPLFDVITPTTFAFIENAVALVILLWVYGIFPEWHKFKRLTSKQILGVVLVSLLSSVLAPYLFYFGWHLSTPNNTFLLSQAETLFTIVLASYFLKEKIKTHQTVGIIVMFLGIYFIASQGFSFWFNFQRGDLFLLLSGVVWAFGNILFKKYGRAVPMELVLVTRFVLGTLVFAILLFVLKIEHKLFIGVLQPIHLGYILAYSIFSVILAKYFYLKSVKHAPLYVWSTVALISPVIGMFLNYWFLHEIPQTFHYYGGALILVGFGILQMHAHKHKNTVNLHHHHHHFQHGTHLRILSEQ